MLVTETFHGYIETTQDVLLIFEGCRRGLLPRICRRLQERERKMIRSGSIFVFDERESGKHPSQCFFLHPRPPSPLSTMRY